MYCDMADQADVCEDRGGEAMHEAGSSMRLQYPVVSRPAGICVLLIVGFWSLAAFAGSPPDGATSAENRASSPLLRVGDCTLTKVTSVEMAYASTITYDNELWQMDWADHPGFETSEKGDTVRLCLMSVPRSCPAGDTRGRMLSATNTRAGTTWIAQNSEH